jgi:LiaI-LiaF-like transmembrane region
MNEGRRNYHYRGSLFFPFLLIVIGLIFLLDNLSVLPGDIWGTVFNLWPLILVGMGIDGLWRRQGIVTAVLWIGVGVVFLLANLGYLTLSILDFSLHFWPILLIAIGFDIFIGRRSIVASLIGLVLILAILVGAVWMFGVRIGTGQMISGEQISQPLQGVSSAQVSISPPAGTLRLQALSEPTGLLVGQVGTPNNQRVLQDYSVNAGRAQVNLHATGSNFLMLPGNADQWNWNLGLAGGIPVDLKVDMGAGEALLNLSGVDLASLKVGLGVGRAEVTLPQSGSYTAQVDGAIGELVVWVPRSAGISIIPGTALVATSYPPGYQKQGDRIVSPDYNQSADHIDLHLNLAIGSVSVRNLQ